ncbi:MAG: pentapeptide repeat-containing protein [Xenococcaceae cyanobacterium MO_188.B32]|nr:pentapeptide repeat-containing protein [Xenococcaceae cyanobacterium MO_188.B32]
MTNQPNSDSNQEPNRTKEEITNNKQITSDSLPVQAEISSVNTKISTEEIISPTHQNTQAVSRVTQTLADKKFRLSQSWSIIIALAIMGLGLWFNFSWLGIAGSIAALLFSLGVVFNSVRGWIVRFLTPAERRNILAFLGFTLACAGLFKYLGLYQAVSNWLNQFKYDEFGSWADWVGALGQISIAVLAVYVAWAQYVISKDLTIQQNRITQQQTIDAYFQGVSDLALNDDGFLEDWPQERAIAEGRTAAILSSVDSIGKAKILRFLSQSRLLTPLRRDTFLGRPILDGTGGYAEDRAYGLRVIHLGVMLAGCNLAGQDLRWTDLSEANMVRANLTNCDLVKANLSRTVLYEAKLMGADLKSTRLFYGSVETASPRSRTAPPNYETGEYTGVVIERCNLTGVKRLNEEQRYYFCAWGGEKTRETIPGGCQNIPNKLGR